MSDWKTSIVEEFRCSARTRSEGLPVECACRRRHDARRHTRPVIFVATSSGVRRGVSWGGDLDCDLAP